MPRFQIWATVIVAAYAVCIALSKLVDWAAEYFWFEALGYEIVFWKIRQLKIGFFLSAFLLSLLYVWINFRIFSSLLDTKAVSSARAPQPTDRSTAAILHRALTDNRQNASKTRKEYSRKYRSLTWFFVHVRLVDVACDFAWAPRCEIANPPRQPNSLTTRPITVASCCRESIWPTSAAMQTATQKIVANSQPPKPICRLQPQTASPASPPNGADQKSDRISIEACPRSSPVNQERKP